MNDTYLVSKILGSARRFALFVVTILLFMGVGIGLAWLLASRVDNRATVVPAQATLPLTGDDENQELGALAQKLTVNAQLQVNGQFYLAPSSAPQDAKAGTLIFDQASNTLQYFNGTSFIPLSAQEPLPQGGVTSLQGQTGAVTLTPGAGITINGTTINNSGILGVNGVPGDVSVTTANGIATISLPQSIATTAAPTFSGLSLASALTVGSGGTGSTSFTSNAVIIGNGAGALGSVAAVAPGQCLISTAGAPTFGACAGGGSGVDSVNALTGNLTLANSSGVGTTITINDASTVGKGIAQFNSTNFSVAAGVVNTIQSIATTASPTFNGLTLSTALTVGNGGTGRSSLTLNSVLVGNGVGQVQQITAGGAGECLVSTAGAPIFAACPGAGGVASIDGQTGAVTVNNATGSGGIITIDDASTVGKGIAQFNPTNFSVAAGVVNTIQGISSTATPTFAGLTLTAPLAVGSGGTGSNNAAGARSNLGAAASGANADITSLTALTTITPAAALTIGSSGQALTLQGNGSTSLTSTNAGFTTTVGFVGATANATINFPALSAGTYQVCTTSGNCLGGAGGANTSLSNLSGVAINTSLLPGSTTIDLGSNANAFRDLYLGGTATNNFRITGTASATRTITLPDETGTVCLSTGNCIGGGGGSAPSGASYLTLGLNGGLSDERVLNAGTNISFTDGGANGNLTVNTVANPTFSTSVTTPLVASAGTLTITPGGALTLGATTQDFTLQGTQGSTITATNGANVTTLAFVNPIASTTINIPALSAGTYTLCTSSGNCPNSGVTAVNTFTGSVTIQGTANQISVNNNTGTITLSTPQDINTTATPTFNGLVVATDTITDFTGTGLQVVANVLQTTLGVSVNLASAEVTGTLAVANGGTGINTTPVDGGIAYGDGTTFQFTAAGVSGQCLVSNGTGTPAFQSCAGNGSGVTLQSAYNNGNTIASADARDIAFTLVDTATDSSFIVTIATGSGGRFAVQNGVGVDVLGVNSTGVSINGTSTLTVGSGAVNFGGNLLVTGNATVHGDIILGNSTSDKLTIASQILGGTPLIFQGATDNSFSSSFIFTDPTANRTITFADETGTVCTTAASVACATAYGSSSDWTTDTGVVNLVSDSNDVTIGSNVAGGKLFIDGDDDQVQLRVQGSAGQSTVLLVVEASDSTDFFQISSDGNVAIGNTSVSSTDELLVHSSGEGASVLIQATGGVHDGSVFFTDGATVDWGIGFDDSDSGAFVLSASDTIGTNNVLRATSSTIDLLQNTTATGDLSIQGNSTLGNASSDTVTFNAQVASHILPSVDDTYDLGSSSYRWRDLYLGPASLHIGVTGNEGVISFDTATSSFGFSHSIAVKDYINFGTVSGVSGYGIRNNAGVLEFKDFGGNWVTFSSLAGGGGGGGGGSGGEGSLSPIPQYESHSIYSSSYDETVPITVPSGTVDGDLLLAMIYTNNWPTSLYCPDRPAGWTYHYRAEYGGNSSCIFSKIASGDSPGTTLTWTFGDFSSDVGGIMMRISGADAVSPIHAVNSLNNWHDNWNLPAYTAPITTTVENTLGISINNGAGGGPPAITGWNHVSGSMSSGEVNVFYRDQAADGSYPSEETDLWQDAYSLAINIAIAPASQTGFYAGVASLQDDFNDNSIDAGKWDNTTNAGASITETSQQLQVSMPGTNGAWALLTSDATDYDMTGKWAGVELVSVTNSSENKWAGLALYDDTSYILFGVDEGMLTATSEYDVLCSVPYNAVTHRYIRIREAAGFTYYETSTDGTTWATRCGEGNPLDMTTIEAALYAENQAGVSASTVIFDNFYLGTDDRTVNYSPSSDVVIKGGNIGGILSVGTLDTYNFNLLAGGAQVAVFDGTDGSALFHNSSNSTTAFQVQNNLGTSLFNIDTANSVITVGGDLVVEGTVEYEDGAADTATAVCRNSAGLLAACTSASRFKDDAAELNLGLDELRLLQPVSYTWNTTGKQDIGFIAEQVAEVIPQSVTYDEEGEVASFNYNTITALLVSAVKQLDLKVEALDTRVANLEQGNFSGNVTVAGGLKVTGLTELATLKVGGKIIGNADTRGTVVLGASTTSQSYSFSSPYEVAPNIVLTPKSSISSPYWVGDVTTTGFTIFVGAAPEAPVEFNFQAQQ